MAKRIFAAGSLRAVIVALSVALLAGCGCLFGVPGVGVAALVEAVLSACWAWLLVTRSGDGSA